MSQASAEIPSITYSPDQTRSLEWEVIISDPHLPTVLREDSVPLPLEPDFAKGTVQLVYALGDVGRRNGSAFGYTSTFTPYSWMKYNTTKFLEQRSLLGEVGVKGRSLPELTVWCMMFDQRFAAYMQGNEGVRSLAHFKDVLTDKFAEPHSMIALGDYNFSREELRDAIYCYNATKDRFRSLGR